MINPYAISASFTKTAVDSWTNCWVDVGPDSSIIGDFEISARSTVTGKYLKLAVKIGALAARGGSWGTAQTWAMYQLNSTTQVQAMALGVVVGTYTVALGDTLALKRVGSTVTLTRNGATIHTFATTSSAACSSSIVIYSNGGKWSDVARNGYYVDLLNPTGGTIS